MHVAHQHALKVSSRHHRLQARHKHVCDGGEVAETEEARSDAQGRDMYSVQPRQSQPAQLRLLRCFRRSMIIAIFKAGPPIPRRDAG